MRKLLFLTSILFGLSTFGQMGNTWEKLGDFPGLKRTRAVGFSIGDYGYLGTGIDTAEHTFNDWWEYDPVSDSWTQKADVPGSVRRSAVAFVIGDFGYVGTGIDSSESDFGIKLFDFYKYDPSMNLWSSIANYPGGVGDGVYQAAAFAVDGKGYIVGGKIASNDYITDVWEYDPDTDTWDSKPSFPGDDRHQLSAFSLEGYGFAGMGTDHDIYRKDWWKYNPVTSSWTAVADLPGNERCCASTFVIQSRAYVVFGTDGGMLDELWQYNPFTDSWSIKNSFDGSARKNAVAFSIGDTAYVGLGKGVSGKKESWWRYFPDGPLVLDQLRMEDVQIYPNPVNRESVVYLPESLKQGTVLIHNLNGKTTWYKQFNSDKISLSDCPELSGMHLLSIVDKKGRRLITKKIIGE